MSGVDVDGGRYPKGAIDAVKAFTGTGLPLEMEQIRHVAFLGGTPLVVVD